MIQSFVFTQKVVKYIVVNTSEFKKLKMKNKPIITVAIFIYAALLSFWSYIAINGLQGDHSIAELFSGIYGIMALFGGIFGLTVGRHFGGFKSFIGATVMYISLGLLAQVAGQLTYSAYTQLFNIEIPYPSWGDVGYFGSVIFYIMAAWSAVKAVRTKVALKSALNKALVVIVPIGLLTLSYVVFLSNYKYQDGQLLATILDFGYPLGQAIYIAIALLALVLSRKFLGGIMKNVILLLIFAFFLQYVADFMFLYQHNQDTWKTAGLNELVYLTAYFVMTMSLIKFNGVILQLSPKKDESHVDSD